MKVLFLCLALIGGCSNNRSVPVVSVPVHSLSSFENVTASWGPAKDCKEIRNYKYCEITGKGIVAFRDNRYFATIEKEKDSVKLPMQVERDGVSFNFKKVFLVPSKDKDWHLNRALLRSALASVGYEVVSTKKESQVIVEADYGVKKDEALKFLSLKALSKKMKPLWNVQVKTSAISPMYIVLPVMATAASESFNRRSEKIFSTQIKTDSTEVIAIKHFGRLVPK